MPTSYSLLLVDDEVELLRIFSRRFERRGYAVTAVDHPSLAEEAVRQTEFHVAVLDRTLRERDGLELMQSLHRIAPDLQVIVLSGHSGHEAERAAFERGAYAYLTKPCRLDDLEATIQRACEHREPIGMGVK